MVDERQVVGAVMRYIEGFAKSDSAALADLFAEEATIEDPVGSSALVGKAAIASFYERVVKNGAKLQLVGPVRVAGQHAAFAFESLVVYKGKPSKIDIIDVFRFDAAGKIIAMQAYFGPSNIHEPDAAAMREG